MFQIIIIAWFILWVINVPPWKFGPDSDGVKRILTLVVLVAMILFIALAGPQYSRLG